MIEREIYHYGMLGMSFNALPVGLFMQMRAMMGVK